MGLRASLVTKQGGLGPSRVWRMLRSSWLLAPVLTLLLLSTPASAQRMATGGAFVEIPSVSQLDVVAASSRVEESGGATTEAGVFHVLVRANHAWKVVLTAAPSADGSVWVRTPTAEGAAAYRQLESGVETVVASGGRGEAVVEIEYRVEGSAAAIASLPLTYTLATL